MSVLQQEAVYMQEALQLRPGQKQKILEFREEFLSRRVTLLQERQTVERGLQVLALAGLVHW